MVTPLLSVATFTASGPGRNIAFGGNSMQHGTAVFEGIRCYQGDGGPAIFRLEDHLRRLLRSAELIGIPTSWDLAELTAQVQAAAAGCGLADCYLRPVIFAAEPKLGLDLRRLAFDFAVEIWPVESEPVALPVAVRVSPWRRPVASSYPVGAKSTGAYVVSAVARTAAAADGFDDAIQLDPESGRVAEATVANVFIVDEGRLSTPWTQESLLAGITRDTVLILAAELGIPVEERPIEVEELGDADEIFLTGTATELVAVATLDHRELKPDRPVFHALLEEFRRTVQGRRKDHLHWLTAIAPPPSAAHHQEDS
jgi:branched-chain amino acid aminotransferase